jgi:hypothetical protein
LVGIPADFLISLGYQLIFFIRSDRPFLPVGIPADFLNWLGYQLIFLIFLTSVVIQSQTRSGFHRILIPSSVIDLPWPYFFSRIFQRDILDFLSPTDISCAHAGGLFHFRKDQGTYSIDPVDYPEKPLFAAATVNRLLNEFILLVLQDVHE